MVANKYLLVFFAFLTSCGSPDSWWLSVPGGTNLEMDWVVLDREYITVLPVDSDLEAMLHDVPYVVVEDGVRRRFDLKNKAGRVQYLIRGLSCGAGSVPEIYLKAGSVAVVYSGFGHDSKFSRRPVIGSLDFVPKNIYVECYLDQ